MYRIGIPRTAAKAYLNGTAKSIKFEHLEMITLYFHCTPKELFQVEDIPKGKIIQGHPMREWLDYRLEFPIQEMLEMTPAQLDESGKFLKELKARKD